MYKIVQGFLCFLCELSFQPIESGCQKFHYPWEVRFESPILGCSGHAWDWAFKSSINCTNTQGTPRCIREQNASYVNLKTDILESGCQDLLSHFKFSSFSSFLVLSYKRFFCFFFGLRFFLWSNLWSHPWSGPWCGLWSGPWSDPWSDLWSGPWSGPWFGPWYDLWSSPWSRPWSGPFRSWFCQHRLTYCKSPQMVLDWEWSPYCKWSQNCTVNDPGLVMIPRLYHKWSWPCHKRWKRED